MSAIGPVEVDPAFVPQTAEDWAACLRSPRWRLFSGQLYKIMVKGDEDTEGHVMPFIPNQAQREFIDALHYRNVILKARQLGFTTVIAIMWLDHALFVPDQRVGIIAHSLEDAATIFRDKVKFAYQNLPEPIRERMPLARDSAKELWFAHNNSAIRVATSMRSGTIHRLHVSEMGKIAAKFPEKAKEIVTGSLPAVPLTGIAIIESTAEGQSGAFYDIATRAEALAQIGKLLADTEWKFHFFPWWRDPGYQVDPTGILITPADAAYFAEVEAETGTKISPRQRAWYIAKRENDFAGDGEKMWQEMPSTSAECWRKSTEGTFYAPQLARARVQGRISRVPYIEQVRVNTFWDIGAGDGTAIWLHQYVGTQDRFIGFMEGWGEGYSHFVRRLRETGYIFGGMFLPHDATHERQVADRIAAPLDMLSELAPDWTWHIVPRVETIQHGIDLTRAKFGQAWFDAEACKAGLDHLGLYRKKWNQRLGVWSHEPEKLEGHSEAADAFRQWAQGFNPALISAPRRPRRRTSGGLAI
ncbi:terminase [Cereibacter sphaeroides]|nr:terminase [Cereibacter sphaeroides]